MEIDWEDEYKNLTRIEANVKITRTVKNEKIKQTSMQMRTIENRFKPRRYAKTYCPRYGKAYLFLSGTV